MTNLGNLCQDNFKEYIEDYFYNKNYVPEYEYQKFSYAELKARENKRIQYIFLTTPNLTRVYKKYNHSVEQEEVSNFIELSRQQRIKNAATKNK